MTASVQAVARAPAPATRPDLLDRATDGWFVCALLLAGLLITAPRLLGDPDTQWHVAVGQAIWRDRAVPWTDTFSYTFAGAPWIAKEWLAQLGLAGLWEAGGWRAVALASAVLIAGTIGWLFVWLKRRLRPVVALAITLVAVALLAPHFLARPLIVSQLCLVAWTIGMVEAVEGRRTPSPWLLLWLVLWVNIHGSFAVAYPIAGAIGLEALLAAAPAERVATCRRWALFGGAALLAGCATPYGVHALVVTLLLVGGGEALPFIQEWQPLKLDMLGVTAATSALAALAVLCQEPRRNAVRILVLAGLSWMAARHFRFLDVYGVVIPILIAGPLARRWPAFGPQRPLTAGEARGPRLLAAGLVVAALAAVVVREPVTAPNVTPRAAIAAARAAGLTDGRVYNDYGFGGYLIAEGVPTFIDGRTDQLFLGGFISGLYAAMRAEPDEPFLRLLDQRGATWALVLPEAPDTEHLDRAPGWRRVHADSDAVVFARR